MLIEIKKKADVDTS